MAQVFRFPIYPLERFAGKSAKIRRPKEITSFSYDASHKLIHDDSSLRYYYNPELNTDLSDGFETFDKHDNSIDEHLDSLLSALVQLERRTGRKSTNGVEVVTWRGMMTKIMTAPYLGNGFEMNAVVRDGTIFIEENFAFGQANQGPQDRRNQQMSFWGYKFETLSTLPHSWAECTREQVENRKHDVVSNKAQYCSIVKTGFGSTSVIIAGEVDCVWDCKPVDSSRPINYVELKTSKAIQSAYDRTAFERKMQRFWAQSFLLGVPKIVVGFRDNRGILKTVEVMETQDIPGMVKRGKANGQAPWDGNTVINFTTAFLEWIKGIVVDEGGMWRIRFKEKGEEIEVEKVEEKSTGGVLTEEYLKWCNESDRNNGGVALDGSA